MKNLHQLIQEAEDYTEAYQKKYAIADDNTLKTIFIHHLAYLINQK